MNWISYIVLGFALLLSFHDILVKVPADSGHHEDSHDDFAEFGDEELTFSEGVEEDHVEVREQSTLTKPKALHIQDLPTMRFLFCVSCGYRQAFDQFSNYIREKYPEMPIEGTNYPPAPWKAYLAQAISFMKMILLAVVISGSNPFASLGMGYPYVLEYAHSNKLASCMMVFLLSNMVEQSLMGTGAFEIYLGDELLWSKLESGRVPAPAELMQMIDSQLALLGKLPAGSAAFGGDFNN